ncbi:hypothetical protein JGU66_23505 [Myxococcaceae bacterium JPH2]|nr:hypothetical protein [Myxococcaceae bacterium JPH2]
MRQTLCILATLFSLSALADTPPSHAGGSHAAATPDAGTQVYSCEMHPEVRADKPGRCPKCGMKLTPVAPADTNAKPQGTGTSGHDHGAHP